MLRAKETLVHAARKIGQLAVNPLLYYEWTRRKARRVNERPVEYAYALQALARNDVQSVLDVGPGMKAWPQLLADCGYHVTAIDEMSGYWRGLYVNRHHFVIQDDVTKSQLQERFDAITCLSVLEHIPDHVVAVQGMSNLLAPGGHLILSFPFNENRYVENVYELPEAGYGQDAPYVCQVYSRDQVNEWVSATGLELVDQTYYRAFTGELWTFGERLTPPEVATADTTHHLSCLLFRKPD